jgi:hypothetical protein
MGREFTRNTGIWLTWMIAIALCACEPGAQGPTAGPNVVAARQPLALGGAPRAVGETCGTESDCQTRTCVHALSPRPLEGWVCAARCGAAVTTACPAGWACTIIGDDEDGRPDGACAPPPGFTPHAVLQGGLP